MQDPSILIENSDPTLLADIYYQMQLTQELDKSAYHLYSQGYLCTYPSSKGQEALFVGTAYALTSNDIYLPYYRDQGALVQRGIPIKSLMEYWAGYQPNIPYTNKTYPLCVPIASQTTHAVGAAYALHYQQQQNIVLCSLGDGATSKGDFYEALNFACVKSLPVVFNINVNNWAISTPLTEQTHDLERKLSGFNCIHSTIDAHHVLTVMDNLKTIKQQVLSTRQPAVILNHTTRLCAHTATDDYAKYADMSSINEKQDTHNPVNLYHNLLKEHNILSEQKLIQRKQQAKATVKHAIQAFKDQIKQPKQAYATTN